MAFSKVVESLLGIRLDRFPGGVRARLHRPNQEYKNVYLRETMTDAQFRTEFYYLIDEPEMDVYLRNVVNKTPGKRL